MKSLKLLALPAVLVVAALTAVPAYANHATVTKLTATCKDQKVCFHIEFTPSDIPAEGSRTITLKLLGREKDSNVFVDTKASFEVTIKGSENGQKQTIDECIDTSKVDLSKFVEFTVKVFAGDDIDLPGDVKMSDKFECQTTPSTPTTPPTTPPTANTTVALAQTGGFDFRLPLIGLILLVAGGALYLVSASRGRSADRK